MTQEDKELLLRDLCSRLPYGVKMLHEGWNYEWDDELSTVERVVGIDENYIYTKVIDTHNGEEYRHDKHCIDLFDDKLFLRPMSSMTEEECVELDNIEATIENISEVIPNTPYYIEVASPKQIDWLNAHHFDYRGLIKKGLAIEVTEENNPYEN